jgi:glutamate racemase
MTSESANRPIGVFDSGVGGLTVVRELVRMLPHENIVYFGDTARLPYGSKSARLVSRYAMEDAIFLNSKHVKAIVIACNTASAVSAEFLQQFIRIPVIGVIDSGAKVAARKTRNKIVGVIGTKSTIKSEAYSRAIRKLDPRIKVVETAAPLLVHLVEEDWVRRDITLSILREYLKPMLDQNIDTLVLGCTHYPLLKEQINIIAPGLAVVDSGEEVARSVRRLLIRRVALHDRAKRGNTECYLSDGSGDFGEWARRVLGRSISAKVIDLEQHISAE